MSAHSLAGVLARLQSLLARGNVRAAVGVLMLLTGAIIWATDGSWMPFTNLIAAFSSTDLWQDVPSTPANLLHYYHASVAVVTSALGSLLIGSAIYQRLNPSGRAWLFRMVSTLGFACTIVLFVSKLGFAGYWSPLEQLMSHPETLPIFGHRMLFVWIADGAQHLLPSLTALRSFYVSQFIAAVLAMYAIERWAAIYVGDELAWLAQAIASLMLAACIAYYNFYDIAVVFFFSAGLLTLYRRQYALFVAVIAIGTLNHEIVLLLVPVAAIELYDKERARVWIPVVIIALVCHFTVRALMQWYIPFERHVDWRIWSNMVKMFYYKQFIIYSLVALAPWYLLGLMSLPRADSRLRRLLILFPLVWLVTLAFGQFHEARQFNAFVPVLVVVLLTAARNSVLDSAKLPTPNDRPLATR